MKKLVLVLSAAGLAVVTAVVASAILTDSGGAQSAGPVPSAVVLTAGAGDKASASGTRASIGRGDSARPEVDYTIDLNSGVMTPLPRAIIQSVARSDGRVVFPTTSRYAASPAGSQLAFIGIGSEGSLQIFIAGLDGSGVHQATHDPAGAIYPAWSPDGTKVVYQGSGGLFVLDVGAGESTPVTDGSPIQPSSEWFSPQSEPQFTPDGASLVYTGRSKGKLVVRIVPVDGGKSTLLIGPSDGVDGAGNGSLSPDGSLVTFLASGWLPDGEHCGPCRFVANADGSERRRIPGWLSNDSGTWSPEGRRIVTSDYGAKDILLVDVGTGNASRVAKGNGAIWLDGHTLLVEVA